MNILYNLNKLSSKKVPTERLLFKYGINKTTKGDFYLTIESAKTIIEAAQAYGNQLNIDYNHSQVSSVTSPDSGISAGTFDLKLKSDGIYASNIKWTEKATNYILNQEYIYTSPAFITELQNDKYIIVEVINFALTNIPATISMDKLLQAASKNFNKNKDLSMTTEQITTETTLNTDEEQKVCAETPENTDENAPAEEVFAEPTPEEMKSIIQDLTEKLAEKSNLVLELEAKIAELQGDEGKMQEEMQSLSKNVKDLTNKLEYNEREIIVNSAISTGKILPAQKNLYLTLSKIDLGEELNKLPAKNALLSKTVQPIIETEKETESKTLAAYAIKRVLGR